MEELDDVYTQDGMQLGTGSGQMFAVFKPKWWMIWRWLWWVLPIRRHAKTVMVFTNAAGFSYARVRMVETNTQLPNVPSPNAHEQTETAPPYTTQTTIPFTGNSSEG